jgi:dihydrolipoamide dehydrogenase
VKNVDCDLLIIGGGPGGYSAAFRAADLGLKVIIAEERSVLGGVCLNVGCIPSKSYLHQAAIIREAELSFAHGIGFGPPVIDLDALRAHKNGIVEKLVGGLSGLAKARKVNILRGSARLTGKTTAQLTGADGETGIAFKYCLLAVGSEVLRLPFLPEDPRILDSTSALELPASQGSMLIIGGGIIGLEMATIYSALGMQVDVVELTDSLMPGADRDLVATWQKANATRLGKIMLETRVTAVTCDAKGINVTFEREGMGDKPVRYDFVLAAAGRVPNGGRVNAGTIGLAVDEGGYIPVDLQMRTNVRNIFAVGDVVGAPMLAHKAVHQGHVAAEVISGEVIVDEELARVAFDARVIPSVAYTNPEIAWAGVTEAEAKAAGVAVVSAKFPWAASGRALANSCEYGFTKLLFDTASSAIVGGAMVGPNAGDMIGEIALAIEMGAEMADIALTIHPHPTLGETIGLASEVAIGSCTDLPAPRKRHI